MPSSVPDPAPDSPHDLFTPPLPASADERLQWGQVRGLGLALAAVQAAARLQRLVVLVTPDIQHAGRLEQELGFFAPDDLPIQVFPDWETLPYDVFAPLPELVSDRLAALYALPRAKGGILVVPVATLMQRLCPRSYLEGNALVLARGQKLSLEDTRSSLQQGGYQCVSQVMVHGEYAVRGSLLDLFPMGGQVPYRIDLFDDEIDSIRTFDAETQLSRDKVERIDMLPAREFPFNETAITGFRQRYREAFEGDPQRSLIYREVSEGRAPGGLEYYLPLFFDNTDTLFDYLPEHSLLMFEDEVAATASEFFAGVEQRFAQRRHDIERPLLEPRALYMDAEQLAANLNRWPAVSHQSSEIHKRRKGYARYANLDSRPPPPVGIQARAHKPAGLLHEFIDGFPGRVLLIAESAGRRETLLETLGGFGIRPQVVDGWSGFLESDQPLCIATAPVEQGVVLAASGFALISETQLLGERVRQARRRKARSDSEQVVRNLTELHEGAPVVHEDHGVGRYIGLQHLSVGGEEQEFLTLEYAGGDKLYVPVASLHLIGRYTGASPEHAPLHRLGTDQWDKARRRAAQKAHDVAAELLDIYARREARSGFAFPAGGEEYAAFVADFPFEETEDQQNTIDAVIADMTAARPMDRLVCGDVGFGKTEVAMRAAFIAAHGGRQVAVLVPTTLLAQQHYQNFSDRFAEWALRVESLSRFRSAKEQKKVLDGLKAGTVDIVVGTHKLLAGTVHFKNLGLVIVDEEHRFGVRHKEKLKSLRASVDMLTLTATPIPRTLNIAMSGLRELSIIATPPAARHPIKTFISRWDVNMIVEACQREIARGGQVYFLHNEVQSIENAAGKLSELLPGARIEVAHGQMREQELERIMRDFYHQRFNVLVCTTIVESGIDVPSANTIIIDRADKLGLAQLHQLRGRVGRSHHRAYAYLVTPPPRSMTADARKRLEAIESLEDLGAGFTLATHDLEIRGAGELLGDEQSGQINEIGFTLYTELLERAVKAIREGRQVQLDRPLDHGAEVDLGIPALIPEDYLADVHTRLVMYKRIASADSEQELRDIQVEMIDRFGLLPDPVKNLFAVTSVKLLAHPLGVRKLDVGSESGRIQFNENPAIDFGQVIRLIQTRPREFKLDGQDKLRFFGRFEKPESRVQGVKTALGQLSSRAA
ncbi:MAG: transcription-repair coupling factor [Pseudomonadota bacterium]